MTDNTIPNATSTASRAIVPGYPWIKDPQDAPSEMNWIQILFNPFGKTRQLHFNRAWTFMFMGRILLFFVPIVGAFLVGLAGIDTSFLWNPVKIMGVSIPGLLVGFVVFTLVTEFTSFNAHVRRLYEANKPVVLAIIVLLPLILASAGFVAGSAGGIAQFEQMQVEASEKAASADAETKQDGSAEANATEEDQAPSAKNDQRQQRGNRRGPPPTQAQMAIGAGVGRAIPIWLLASFGAMLWTLLYVARLPNGGTGKLSAASDDGAIT